MVNLVFCSNRCVSAVPKRKLFVSLLFVCDVLYFIGLYMYIYKLCSYIKNEPFNVRCELLLLTVLLSKYCSFFIFISIVMTSYRGFVTSYITNSHGSKDSYILAVTSSHSL